MLLKQIQFSLYLIKETGSFLFQQMVLKINGIFEARRGKKKMKRVSPSTESSSGRGVCKFISHIHTWYFCRTCEYDWNRCPVLSTHYETLPCDTIHCFIRCLSAPPSHVYPLSFMDMFTFLAQLCLTHFLLIFFFPKDGRVIPLYGIHMLKA